MPTLSDLVVRHTSLDAADLEWLHSLVSDWQLLADLSFADLILWAPLLPPAAEAGGGEGRAENGHGERYGGGWIAIAQMRPTTGPTVYHDDVVGTVVARGERHLIDTAWNERRICREGDPDWSTGVPVREETIPVRRMLPDGQGRFLAIIQRSTNLSSARTPSRLELTYLQSASDLAQMVAEGRFPFSGDEPILVRSPRVGDGLLRLDRGGRVTYASPNALSAYRRLGLHADLVGAELGRVTATLCYSDEPINEDLMIVASGRAAKETEVESGGTIVQLRAIPLIVGGGRIGALVLIRDVTELRRRERELMTKDATIREIHHRVKNNLQTVAALLRLQARRLQVPEGREALEEAVRRVGSIAIVHETLSHAPEEFVDFDDIADRVIAMAGEVSAAESAVTPRRVGAFGVLPSLIATPLAMALTELLQNALQHGRPRRLQVVVERVGPGDDRLNVTVWDDGQGVPEGFDLDSSTSLGLQIVRTLVEGELSGKLSIGPREGGGTEVMLSIPLPAG
ncbi:PAS domain-containing sensor histidine kinase [Nonomuraea roseoviolacea subsp. roseoviolacea]|uniref:histidine kinase n=1 Tax=Nonomuraea roseoviolacea subsp. carminata TaxID=160689 RepID=A0ABT1K3Q7_9ACTN|nr:PAS domain-containing sensor histidine kinase [Nonomuraea roseoviolacea]MCP2348631.1 two-component sensor histidine kinase [Nonomuraea roseoviolacea subsp. carminata]